MTAKQSFVLTGGQLVCVTAEYIHPPIPYRGDDWCAHYTRDESERPNYGWGATAEDAIASLMDNYGPDETGGDYEPDYDAPTAREEQARSYGQKYGEAK